MSIKWLAPDWSKLRQQPQSYGLFLGTAGGYGLLIALVGSYPMAWVGGGAIAIAMVSSWVGSYRKTPADDSARRDLLNPGSFQRWLETIQPWRNLRKRDLREEGTCDRHRIWQSVKRLAIESQAFAVRICDREPALRPELLEALHTVLDLAERAADGLTIQTQLETPKYQQIARHQLQQSCDRLQQTHHQLQQLQDQVVLSTLPLVDPLLPQSLETLIAANRQILDP